MWFIFCGDHPPLETRTQASDSGPMSPLVFIYSQMIVSKYVFVNCILLKVEKACLSH